ncbi:hypothetical protein MUN89_00165 [Halobacillus salinarum]|uniref:Uncharacterized protein n=1 Tax=Halobacillus salinarum TaxID=2932257 RepID=A0ABY4EJV1_9BACI|nr:hypothetical protein [Halobacillus salinarum]UOQ44449.1 hypothetical protein MUN89_00165 [Halobacillus salinarum]
MKNYGIVFFAVLAITVTSTLIYHAFQFKVDVTGVNYKEQVESWFNRSIDEDVELELKKTKRVGESNTYVSVFASTKYRLRLGHVFIKKGWFGKYKFSQASQSLNPVTYTDIVTSKGNYAVLSGENIDRKYVKVKGIMPHHTINAALPKDDYFIICKKLPDGLRQPYPVELYLYDADGNRVLVEHQ